MTRFMPLMKAVPPHVSASGAAFSEQLTESHFGGNVLALPSQLPLLRHTRVLAIGRRSRSRAAKPGPRRVRACSQRGEVQVVTDHGLEASKRDFCAAASLSAGDSGPGVVSRRVLLCLSQASIATAVSVAPLWPNPFLRSVASASAAPASLPPASPSQGGLLSLQPQQQQAQGEESSVPSIQSRLLRGLGLGEPDVYYPRLFLGEWRCESTLLSVDTPEGDDVTDMKAAREAELRLGMPVVYHAKFIEYGGNVIADRLYTTSSLVDATIGKGVLVDAQWEPSRANVLNLTLRGGIRVQNLITKRSSELSAPGQFDVSEYSKQVLDNQGFVDGPPSVKASRNLTRFRWDPATLQSAVDQVEAFQRVAMYPTVGGSAAGRGEAGLSAMDVLNLGMGAKPTTIYKYRLHLTRIH